MCYGCVEQIKKYNIRFRRVRWKEMDYVVKREIEEGARCRRDEEVNNDIIFFESCITRQTTVHCKRIACLAK